MKIAENTGSQENGVKENGAGLAILHFFMVYLFLLHFN